MKKILIASILTVAGFFVFSAFAYAQTPTPIKLQIVQPTGALTNLNTILTAAIQLIIIVAGLIAFVFLLLGGIKWISSGGDKGQVEAARNQIIQALIGLVVVFAAWGIIVLVEGITGIGLGFSKPLKLPTFYGTPAPTQQTCTNGGSSVGCNCPGAATGGICYYP